MRKQSYDPTSIRELFDDLASTYGIVNLVSSFGFSACWRNQTVDRLPLTGPLTIVDLMSGMGELWRSLSPRLSNSARVVGLDLSPEMVRRTPRNWTFATEALVADVLAWDPPNDFADVIVSSFGLKTFNREQQQHLARIVARVLKPGGSYSFVEISVPPSAPLRFFFMLYVSKIIPIIGRVFAGNPDCYRMLGVYTKAFGDTRQFAQYLRDSGLTAVPTSHFFGCATGVRGSKPKISI